MPTRHLFLLLTSFVCFAISLSADPLTKQLDIDFGRDVASRNLKGLAARSDGRLLPGPTIIDLTGPKIGDILWTLKSLKPNHYLVGTGPDGKVQEVTFHPKENSYAVREVADVAETHAMTLLALPNGDLLIGTSPTGVLYLYRKSEALARVPLPVDSVFDLLALPDGTVLAATGNPGKIYRIDLGKLAKTGIVEGKAENENSLAGQGITLFGEIRDRNIRRIIRLNDGRIIAGSAPKGNVYSFAATGGAPLFLQENRDAEVVDLLPQDDGGFYAGIVFSAGDIFRLSKPSEPKEDTKEGAKDSPAPRDIFKEKEPKPTFTGRSAVVRFPAAGFPEPVISKNGLSLYRLAQHRSWLLLTAGEQGDILGYDPEARRSLTFAGSVSAQLNDLARLDDGRFLLLRNNAPGLALLSFDSASTRELETKRLDLGQPAELGAVRFPRVSGIDLKAFKLEASTSNGSDELEGWSEWTELKLNNDTFKAAGLRGRYVRYRLRLTGGTDNFQIDIPTQYHLPQNRRPALTDFRIFPPNQGLIPASEPSINVTTTLGQLLSPRSRDGKDDASEKRKGAFLNSQVIPQPGTQVVYWSLSDPDGDNLAYTFSIQPQGSELWTDLAVRITDSHLQFETGGMAEGIYLTRLIVAEQSPRPETDRLTYTYETDNLLVDHTAPKITATNIARKNGNLFVTVTGQDERSLLEGVEIILNNGTRDVMLHPVDGVLDSGQESFTVEIAAAKASGATSVEIILYDQSGNVASTRLPLTE